MDHFSRPQDIPPQHSSITFAPPNQPSPDGSHFLSEPQTDLDKSDQNISFMKGPKRKRLAKACDACHKSKRRCDGTAPCSNCYFASKKCTYTDASGKPVPAPRPFKSDRADGSTHPRQGIYPAHPDNASSISPSLNVISMTGNDASQPPSDDDRSSNPRNKRLRTDLGKATATPSSGTPPRSLAPPLTPNDRSVERDQTLTRELVHLFFAYRQPQSMIIHQPSFLFALNHGTVPQHLLLAVCAAAAPLSKQPRLRTSPCRWAGEAFAQEAVSLMFDKNRQLVCEKNLATAQTLILLQLYARMGKSLWNGQYHQLALGIVTKLGVFDSDSIVHTPHPSSEQIDACIERECARRVFWLIFISDCFGTMLYRRVRLATDSQMSLRLPIDETSFELSPLTTLPEFIAKPNPPHIMCSELGQLIRILSIHDEVQRTMESLNSDENGRHPFDQLLELEKRVEAWLDGVPEHMRFSEDSLWVHVTQYDTASNMGAWCFFIMHIIHASCTFALNSGRQRFRPEMPTGPTWMYERIIKIIEALGRKAKSSILLGLALWPLFKYAEEPPGQKLIDWSSEFEEVWGVRMQDLCQRAPDYGQALQTQLVPPPLRPSVRLGIHAPMISSGSASPASRGSSDISPLLVVQPPNFVPQSRITLDTRFHSQPPASHLEARVPSVGHDTREKDGRNVVNDSDIDPALQTVPNSRMHVAPQLPSSQVSPPSLPSLKASGLLEWPLHGSAEAATVPSSTQASNWQPPQHFAPPRQTIRDPARQLSSQPNQLSQPEGARPPAPSGPSGMPVGLQWLAHESSVPRTS